jgi:peptidase M23-like protein
VTLAGVLCLLSAQPAFAAGNLTLPFNIPNPRITSWMDHHYPNRQADGIMIRFDGATGYAYDGHRGTDFAVPSNTPVVAADDGTVIYSEWSNDGGWGVVIDHATDRTAYFHNNQLFVYPGQHVSRGQLIALSGSTGNSTGPHVHFEVRDLQTPWHSIDPYGWTGKGQDPWNYDLGYLWSSNPPVPFLLPLAFFAGARWDYWYGTDGPPPPVRWQLRDGGHGLGGYAAQWDADPGAAAARTPALSGSAAVPGPGSHVLHLRVWDRAGASADITYLYLYDVDPPTAAATIGAVRSSAVTLHWSGTDFLSGVKEVAVEVSSGGSGFRPWMTSLLDQPSPGLTSGAARFLGQPGTTYQFRLRIHDAARNAAPTIVTTASVPVAAGPPPTVNDQAILGPLPDLPAGSASAGGLRQEHPLSHGAMVLGGDASIEALGGNRTVAVAPPASTAAAIDVARTDTGSILLLADGTSWNIDGTPGPRFVLNDPVRLLAGASSNLLAVDANGAIVLAGGSQPGPGANLAAGAAIRDAALFPGSNGGLMIDSFGGLHAFNGADGALIMAPSSWTLPTAPEGIELAGTPDAPAGIISDSSGDWQTFGSLAMFPDRIFSGPVFDPATGLPVR